MFKSALAILFSLLFVFFCIPEALAERSSASGASHRKATKRSVVIRHWAAANKRHATNSRRVNASLDARERLIRKVVLAHGKRRVVYQRVAYGPVIPVVPPVLSAGDLAGLNLTRDSLELKSNVAYVIDQSNSQVLFEKNSNVALPIASITKLMTGLVVVEAHQDMDELLEVTTDDIDKEKNSRSRLKVGAQMTRTNLLHIALMSSENRAASALGRNYPGGLPAFIVAMNEKAKMLGMTDTHYVDSSGLSSHNVASARDLAKLVTAAQQYPILCQYSTDTKYVVDASGRPLQYANSNRLVASPDWEIGLQKTGYISEAGRCLVMQAKIEGRSIVMVFLDSKGKFSRLADAGRIRKWVESLKQPVVTHNAPPVQS
jgi:D-alanyl-D-alanine endopeptidase (penicillin-binding protein 7)